MTALQSAVLYCVGLDYLSDPTNAIFASQSLAADIFGADRTWFLVNGTSVGLQVSCMTP